MRSVGGSETRRNVLVDGNNLVHRAYYVFVENRIKEGKPVLCSPSGFPTGIVYGFLSMLSSWLYGIQSPTSVSVFFDGTPARRLALDPGYKAGRDAHGIKMSPSDDLPSMTLRDGKIVRGELDLLSHVLRMLGFDVYHDPREEADDLIASYVRSRPGEVHVIISSDKDFFQLVDDRVVLYRPGNEGFFDAERVVSHMEKQYKVRITPSQIRMFKSLTGDPSDSIPGVPRLRKKVAAPLCSHPDVASLYATGLPGFSKAEREATMSLRDRIATNFELVGLDSSLDVEARRRPGSEDIPAAKDLCREDLGMESIDFSGFKLGPRVVTPVPMESWLLDI